MSVILRDAQEKDRSASIYHLDMSAPASLDTQERTVPSKAVQVKQYTKNNFLSWAQESLFSKITIAGEFIGVEQVFDLPYDSNWEDVSSQDRAIFDQEMRAALSPLYNSTDNFEGININNVTAAGVPVNSSRKKRAITQWG